MNKQVITTTNEMLEDTIMKRAKQILWLVPFYVLSLSVSPASAKSITLSTSTGHAGDVVTVTGSGFFANTSVNVWFDQNLDFQPTYPGAGAAAYLFQCGTSGNIPCEPFVSIITDPAGNFVANLMIPPGRKADFLGAGTYFICVDDNQGGGGAEAWAPFKVLASFTATRSGPYVLVWGSNFVPYRLSDGQQSNGRVWMDTNSDFKYRYYNGQQWVDEGELYANVWVLPDGTLSGCAGTDPICGTGINTINAIGGYVRVDILREGEMVGASPLNVEASAFLPLCFIKCISK